MIDTASILQFRQSFGHMAKVEDIKSYPFVLSEKNPRDHEAMQSIDPLYWAISIGLVFGSSKFDPKDHEYQVDYIRDDHPNEVIKSAAQMMKTTGQIIKRIHHLIYGYYPQGGIYLFPTDKLVQRFSQSRFSPMVEDNPTLARFIGATDNLSLKRIGKSNLYFIGSRVTQKIEGEKKSSVNLKDVPADFLVEDEYDEIDQDMSAMAAHRLDHSKVRHRARISTPSIPGFGIDAVYEEESDRQVWLIKCLHCGEDTCLELEFPTCIHDFRDGRVIRACKSCGEEIFTRNGRWIPLAPSRSQDCRGRWISQLNSSFVPLKQILKDFRNPPNNNIGEVYNSTLGMAYISAEDRLIPSNLDSLIDRDNLQLSSHPGPTAAGVDVGAELNVLVGERISDLTLRIIKAVRIDSFNSLHDLFRDFHVKVSVIDREPEVRKVEDFIENEKGVEIFGCDYQEHKKGTFDWDSNRHLVTVNRTEICDLTHNLVMEKGRIIFPRHSREMDEYVIPQLCSPARVLREDDETGVKRYRYVHKPHVPDHYYHTLNYLNLAAMRIPIYVPKRADTKIRDRYAEEDDSSRGSFMGV